MSKECGKDQGKFDTGKKFCQAILRSTAPNETSTLNEFRETVQESIDQNRFSVVRISSFTKDPIDIYKHNATDLQCSARYETNTPKT